MAVEVIRTGKEKDHREIVLFDMSVPDMEMRMTNYGGIIMLLKVPDRAGKLVDIVLGFDDIDDYFTRSPYFGALIGRYANRIKGGSFDLDGHTYSLPTNSHGNTLHGGGNGFDKKVMAWQVTGSSSVRLLLESPDGENGFPGTVKLTADYEIINERALRLRYQAVSDKDTVLSITNHSYFNLNGKGDILGHEVRINADRFTEVDRTAIPTGHLMDVSNTPMDFRIRHAIGDHICEAYEQLAQLGGYDHNYALNDGSWAAEAYSPETGILMKVETTLPGMQFYSGCNLGPIEHAKGDAVYEKFDAFCFETQFFPDTPNQPDFPSAVLRRGDKFEQETIYSFSIA